VPQYTGNTEPLDWEPLDGEPLDDEPLSEEIADPLLGADALGSVIGEYDSGTGLGFGPRGRVAGEAGLCKGADGGDRDAGRDGNDGDVDIETGL